MLSASPGVISVCFAYCFIPAPSLAHGKYSIIVSRINIYLIIRMNGRMEFPQKCSPRTLPSMSFHDSIGFYKIPTCRLSFGTDGEETPNQRAINVQGILYIIDKLNVDKSLGPDGTCLRVLKELKGEIGELLAKMCKCLLKRDVMPESSRGWLCHHREPWELLNSETDPETRQVIQT